jgi:lysophospholipase L1-like esterase
MPPDRESPASRRIIALAVLTVIVVGLLASELLVRLLLPHNGPETFRTFSLGYAPAVFTRSRLEPVGRLVHVDGGKAWGTKPADAPSDHVYHINALGFRGPPFAASKPSGTTRVFVLGGSAVFDQNVSDDSAAPGNSWPNRAESLLRARGFRVEVINAGIPAHASADAVGRMVTELWLYQPDVVVLYSGWNDLKNFRGAEISPAAPLSRLIRPLDPASDPFRNYRGAWDRLLCHSQLYVKFRNLYLGRRLAVSGEGFLPTGTVASSYGPYGPRQYELALQSFVDVARNIGARPVLATEASLALSPDTLSRARIAYDYQLLDHAGLRQGYEELHRLTRTVAAAKQVPLLDAGALLSADAANLADHVHFSPTGSAAMARLLADFLTPLLPEVDGGAR